MSEVKFQIGTAIVTLCAVVAMGSVFTIIAILCSLPFTGPDALPDPGKDPLRGDNIPSILEPVRHVHDPIVLKLPARDSGPFMNTLMHQAEASGGYVVDRFYYQDVFEPSHYRNLTLDVPESFFREMQPLIEGEGGHVNSAYREWAMSREPVATVSPVASDLVRVNIVADYTSWPTPSYHRSAATAVVTFIGSVVIAAGSLAVFPADKQAAPDKNSSTSKTVQAVKGDGRASPVRKPSPLCREQFTWELDGRCIIGTYRDYEVKVWATTEGPQGPTIIRCNAKHQGGSLGYRKAKTYEGAIAGGLQMVNDLHLAWQSLSATAVETDQQVPYRGSEVLARYLAGAGSQAQASST